MESENLVVAVRYFRPNRECTAIANGLTRRRRMVSIRAEETKSHLEAVADEGEAGRLGRDGRQFLGLGAARVRDPLFLVPSPSVK
jgi:hypothetical protein